MTVSDVASGSPSAVRTLEEHTVGVLAVAWSPDRWRLACCRLDGTVWVYALVLDELAALARERPSRTLTGDECLRYLYVEAYPAEP